MPRPPLPLAAAALVLSLTAASVATAEPAHTGSPADLAAVEAVIRTSIGWALAKDRGALLGAVSHGDDLFIFHPDSDSTIRGYEPFRAMVDRVFMNPAFRATGFEIRDLAITIAPAGDTAWFSALLDDGGEWNGRPIGWKNARWTGVLARRGGAWALVQMHFSLASDAVVAEHEAARRAGALATPAALEQVAAVGSFMPTGVAVSRAGRVFLCAPRWGDPVAATVVELRDGAAVPFPDAATAGADGDPAARLVSVQSVVVDAAERLWALDTGIAGGRAEPGAAKLVAWDLAAGAPAAPALTVPFPANVMVPGTYLNDVRVDTRRGAAGTAYVTDSSAAGPNGILVVDLATGTVRRRLAGHPSVRPDPSFMPVVEGHPLRYRRAEGSSAPFAVGADGIALSPDGATLYYCPLSARRLYGVATAVLADTAASDDAVAAAVQDLGDKPASDGLETDATGRLYVTAYELDAILVRGTDGTWGPLVRDARLLWPDTLAAAASGHLYVVANQLHRQPAFHGGTDRRRPPYLVARVPIP
jgi:sugar lactone lactonase YvrE